MASKILVVPFFIFQQGKPSFQKESLSEYSKAFKSVCATAKFVTKK